MEATDNQAIIYGVSSLYRQSSVQDHKVYNWEDMGVNMDLCDYPNTLNHEIKTTSTVRKFKNYTEKDDEEWINREENIN